MSCGKGDNRALCQVSFTLTTRLQPKYKDRYCLFSVFVKGPDRSSHFTQSDGALFISALAFLKCLSLWYLSISALVQGYIYGK